MPHTSRRQLLTSAGVLVLTSRLAGAATVKGGLPWRPGSADPPHDARSGARSGPWRYFTPEEATIVEALVDRLIPADPETPGGKDLGCAVFIDRQLAGPYGSRESYYMSGPFQEGTKQQGPQSPMTPAQHYRQALAALEHYCRANFHNKGFAELSDERKDELIKGLEDDALELEGTGAREFFELLLKDTQNGFFADPIYGGNKGMAAWKMIGFPGARYDYRDWVERHNERFPLPPVGIADHPGWSR